MQAKKWSWGDGVNYERVACHGRQSHQSSWVSVQLHWRSKWGGQWHDFPLHAAFIAKGRYAVRRIAWFIREFM